MQEIVFRGLSLLGREAAKIVLPSDCIVCDEALPWRARIASCCATCWSELPRITESRCRRCASPWSGSAGGENFVCLDCHDREWNLEWIDSWGHYRGGLERVLSAFKFRHHDFLARPLAGLLGELLATRNDIHFDRIVPIPMTAAKRRRRGYNQAELLGAALSRVTAIPIRRSLRKRRENETQSMLPKADRRANVRDAFSVSGSITGDRILLVDDICTTGETLQEASRALRAAGAASVCAVTVARA